MVGDAGEGTGQEIGDSSVPVWVCEPGLCSGSDGLQIQVVRRIIGKLLT